VGNTTWPVKFLIKVKRLTSTDGESCPYLGLTREQAALSHSFWSTMLSLKDTRFGIHSWILLFRAAVSGVCEGPSPSRSPLCKQAEASG